VVPEVNAEIVANPRRAEPRIVSVNAPGQWNHELGLGNWSNKGEQREHDVAGAHETSG
jgi:hypothetical protein